MAPCKPEIRLSAKTKKLVELDERYSAGGTHPLPIYIESGEGSVLYDVDGKKMVDFIAMVSTANLGQCHPKLVEATMTAAKEATVVNLATKVAQWPLFAREMCDRFGYDRIIGMVSGTEAADAAIKFGRKWGIKTKGINPREALILGASDNYHGMGSGIWPIMNDMGQESDFGIFNDNLTNKNPNTGNLLRYGHVEDFEELFASDHKRIAAVILECIRGVKPTFEEELSFATGVRKLCTKYNILFIADEIRMGTGKTGKFLCSDWMWSEKKPDMVTMGKSISGGAYPASYILGTKEVMDLIGHYQSVATYGQTPMGIAVTRATLKIIDDEDLLRRAAWIGTVWQEETAGWKFPWVNYVTNRGADFNIMLKPVEDPNINGMRFGMICYSKGLLVAPDGNRIRLGVALNIPEEDLRLGISILKESLEELPKYGHIDIGPSPKGPAPVL